MLVKKNERDFQVLSALYKLSLRANNRTIKIFNSRERSVSFLLTATNFYQNVEFISDKILLFQLA